MTALATEPAAAAELVGTCDGCGRHRPIVAGILLLGTEDLEPEDFGFCTEACLVVFARRRWMEG